jgi:hypothetical protein
MGLDYSPHIRNMLAFISSLAFLGPTSAHMLNALHRPLRPLSFDLFVVAVGPSGLENACSLVVFYDYLAPLYVAAMYFWPYAVASVECVDPSGRVARGVPTFVLLGGAGGPAFSGKLIDTFSFQAIADVAASSPLGHVVVRGHGRSDRSQDTRLRMKGIWELTFGEHI